MKKPVDTQTFKFVNTNPHNRKTSDCVFRALASVFDISWEKALLACVGIALKKGVAPNDPACYGALLTKLGIEKEKQPRTFDGMKITGKSFCLNTISKDQRILAHIGGHHIVAIKDGRIEDIWDSTNGCIGNYWVIPNDENILANLRNKLDTLSLEVK